MITRAKAGILKPKRYSDVFQLYSAKKSDPVEPNSVKEALNLKHWKSAMKEEYDALMRNATWNLVPFSPSYNVVGKKWVFKVKHNLDGSLQKCKARLVAKGFHQRPGIDFSETFSPVIKPSTIRVILTIAVSKNWVVKQLDVNNAFLNGQLQEAVYMYQPEGFIDPAKPTFVCKLNKALYGLKQAPRAWFDKLRTTLISWGFKNAKCDSSLFFFNNGDLVIFVLIYVDDMIVTGNCSKSLQKLTQDLHKLFALKDLGDLHLFLGIEVKRTPDGLLLTQTRYIEKLLKKTGMENANPCFTPAVGNKQMSHEDGDPLENPTEYRSLIGALQYVVHTRPDLAFTVNRLSQFLQNPTTTRRLPREY